MCKPQDRCRSHRARCGHGKVRPRSKVVVDGGMLNELPTPRFPSELAASDRDDDLTARPKITRGYEMERLDCK